MGHCVNSPGSRGLALRAVAIYLQDRDREFPLYSRLHKAWQSSQISINSNICGLVNFSLNFTCNVSENKPQVLGFSGSGTAVCMSETD
jgi:hypothetical protein